MRFGRFTYLLSLIFVFVIPLIVEWYFLIDRVNKLNLISFCIGIVICGSLWDKWATRHGNRDPLWLWQFSKTRTLGLVIFGLPIEEYIFYIVTSLNIIFTWEGLRLISESGDYTLYTVFPFIALWSFTFILIPYYIGIRHKDKL
jgi:lycopene cyclase domain-containing protein